MFKFTKENANINQTVILKTIFGEGVVSRAELAKKLNLSKPTVNEYIDKLLNSNIIIEAGEGESAVKGGRKPILIVPNSEYKYIAALDLNYTKPIISLGSLTGIPLDRFFVEKYDTKDMCNLVKKYINELIARNEIGTHQIGAIVISTPGIVNGKTGDIILNPQFEDLVVVNLKTFLKKEYGLPVLIKNDVNMAAIGEAKFLMLEGRNMLFVSCGMGLGAAVMTGGKLYEGENYSAGEIGYSITQETGEPLEQSLCIRWLIGEAEALREQGNSSIKQGECIDFERIVKAFEENDNGIIDLVKLIGKKLGITINNAISLVDVSRVVIGGDYIVFKDVIIPEIEDILRRSRLFFKPEIIPTSLAYAGGIVGCFDIGTNYVIENIKV